jgi:two-component system sensor histidine kinase MprB
VTLRSKVAVALIVLTTLATVAIGGVAYYSTDHQLASEIDTSLRDVATYSQTQGGRDHLRGDENHGVVQLQTVLVQQLAADGSVLSSPDGATVPVTDADRAIAARGSGELFRPVSIDGHPYRMLTTGGEHDGAVQVLRPLSESQGVLDGLRLRILLAAIVVILAAAVVGWLLSRRVTGGLRSLAAAAGLVADTGRLDVDIDESASDETGQLARAFTRMLGALDRSQVAQRRLVQDAGHELRTPLTSLRTNLDVLARHPELDTARRGAIVSDLQGETRELTSLVNELIELGLGGATEIPPSRFELAAVAERVATRAYRRSGRTVTVQADGSVVFTIEPQLERALANLVDNAIKFSPAGSPVQVGVEAGRVTVRDRGAGLTPADLPRVFDRFYRSDDARQQPGSGLGLSIVQDVAVRSGGSVFASNHPDGGAAVGFVLPLAD